MQNISDLVTCSGRDTQPCGTLCASQTNGHSPCSAAQVLSHRQAPPPLHTHSPSHTPHTLSLTPSHTPHSPSHTLQSPLYTYSLTHTHTRERAHKHRAHRSIDRKHGDPGAVLTHQARGACGNSPESPLSSVAGPSTHWEPLGP